MLADQPGDRVDAALAPWVAARAAADVVAAFVEADVPAAEVVSPDAVDRNPQLVARGFFEPIDREVVGVHRVPSLPYRFASRGDAPWHRTPAPLIGEHYDEFEQVSDAAVQGRIVLVDPRGLALLRYAVEPGPEQAQRVAGDIRSDLLRLMNYDRSGV